jgi:hypothetical protein
MQPKQADPATSASQPAIEQWRYLEQSALSLCGKRSITPVPMRANAVPALEN